MYKRLLLCLSCAQIFGILASRAATFTVTSTDDAGAGTLRQAILDANASPGADVIEFNISPASEKTIFPSNTLGALPGITDPLTIEGTTQPGFSGKAIVEIAGDLVLSVADGLNIATSNCVIRGLVINRFRGNGIEISGGNNVVTGCVVGLDLAGAEMRGNSQNGVYINGGMGNAIGGTSAERRNIISGNGQAGVLIEGATAERNVVMGNY